MSMTSAFRALLLAGCALFLASAAEAATGKSIVTPGSALGSGSAVVYAGQPMTLTAKFPGASNGLSVSFKDGDNLLGSAPLSNGSASLNVRLLIAGTHTLSATAPGASATGPLTAPSLAQTVLMNATTTSLQSASNPQVLGQPSKFSVTVNGLMPAGQVGFREGTTVLGAVNVVNGVASFSYTFASAGNHSVQAFYAGDANNNASASPVLVQSISPVSTSTTLSSSASTTTVGTTVTLKATIAAPVSSGTVVFLDGTTALGSAPIVPGAAMSVASLNTSFAKPGAHSLTAAFQGTSNFRSSVSAPVIETVNLAGSTTLLSSALNPAPVGRAVALTAKVSGTPVDGTVSFRDGTTVLGSANLVNGVANFNATFSAIGTHSLSAVYSGGATLAASQSAPLGEVVVIAPTTTQVTASASTVPVGTPLKLTAAISGWNPTGTVKFLDGTTLLGSATIAAATSGASASLTTTFTSGGPHTLTASYAGNASNAPSTSSVLTVTASAAATSTTLAANTTTPATGTQVSFTITVAGSGTTAPTGAVTLRNGSTTVGSAALSGGKAVFSLGFATAGTYSMVAAYGGSTGSAASTSNTLVITVGSTGPKPPATGNGINYYGGPVMSSGTNLYYIWYGNWSGSAIPAILNNFGQGIGGSPYFHINTTYSDSTGKAVADAVTLMPSISDNYSKGKSLDDSAVFSVVNNAISSGKLPLDPNGIYFVFTASDVNETTGFCTQYCGWHSSSQINGVDVKFSFIGNPERCPSACAPGSHTANGSAAGDFMASVLAHELSETVSDPDLNAWADAQGNENGDKCAWNFGATSTDANGNQYNITLPTGRFLIQQMWLNAQGGRCTLSFP